ncbi:MAG: hypothetical protein ACJ0DI_11640, partial [bacterium]
MKNIVILFLFICLFFGCDGGYSGNEDEMGSSISSDTVGDETTEETTTSNCPSSGCLFVTVGNSGTILTSPDGITWTKNTDISSSVTFQSITFRNQTYLALTGDKIFKSSNGISWIDKSFTANTLPLRITYGNNIILIVGYYG